MLSTSRTSLVSGNYDDVSGDFLLPELVKRRDTLILNREDRWSIGLFVTIIIGLLFMLTGALLTFIFPGVFVLPIVGIGLIGLVLVVSSASLLIRSYCFCREIKNRLKAVDLLLEYKESCISFNNKITQCYGRILDFRAECLVEEVPFLTQFRNNLIRYSNEIDVVTQSLQHVYTEEIKISDFIIGFKTSLAALHQEIDVFSEKSQRDLLHAAEILKRTMNERRQLEDFMQAVEGHFESLAISLTESVPGLVKLLIDRTEELSQIESAILTDSKLESSDISSYQEILNRSDEVVKTSRDQFNRLSIELLNSLPQGFPGKVEEEVSCLKISLEPLLSKGAYLKRVIRQSQAAGDLLGDSALKIKECQEQILSMAGILDFDHFCSDNWSQTLYSEMLDLKREVDHWESSSAGVRNDIIEHKEMLRARTVQMRLGNFLKDFSEAVGSFLDSSRDINKVFVQRFIRWLVDFEASCILDLESQEQLLMTFLSDYTALILERSEDETKAFCLKYSLPISNEDEDSNLLIEGFNKILVSYDTQLLAVGKVSSLLTFASSVSEDEDVDSIAQRVKEYMRQMQKRCLIMQKEDDRICGRLQMVAEKQEEKELKILQRLDMIQAFLSETEESHDTKEADVSQSFINLIRERFSLERSTLPSLLLSFQIHMGQLLVNKGLKKYLSDIFPWLKQVQQTSNYLGALIIYLDQVSCETGRYSRLKKELEVLLEAVVDLEKKDE